MICFQLYTALIILICILQLILHQIHDLVLFYWPLPYINKWNDTKQFVNWKLYSSSSFEKTNKKKSKYNINVRDKSCLTIFANDLGTRVDLTNFPFWIVVKNFWKVERTFQIYCGMPTIFHIRWYTNGNIKNIWL